MSSVFRSNLRGGLIRALENLEEDPIIEAPLEADSADSAIVEATEVAGDIDAGVAEVESTQDDAATLGDIADTLEASEETGGLDPVAAEITQVAVESIYARLGVTRHKQPALEGFSDKDSRVKFTRLAIEDIRATIKKAWLAVINAFQSIKQWVVNFFKAIFDANEKLLQRGKALEAKLKATKGTAKEAKFSAGGIAKALTGGGAFTKANALSIISQGPGLPATAQDIASSAAKDIKVKEMIEDKAKFDGFRVPAFGSGSEYPAMKKDGAPDGMHWVSIKAAGKGDSNLAGGKKVALLVPASETEGAAAFAVLSKLQVQVVTADGAGDAGSDVDVLSLQEIGTVITDSVATTKAVITAKADVVTLEKLLDGYIAEAKAAAQVSEAEGAAQRSSAIRSALTGQTNAVAKGATTLLKEATNLAKAGLDYAEKSLAQYKEEAAAAPTAAAKTADAAKK